jgi:hypothetical protein
MSSLFLLFASPFPFYHPPRIPIFYLHFFSPITLFLLSPSLPSLTLFLYVLPLPFPFSPFFFLSILLNYHPTRRAIKCTIYIILQFLLFCSLPPCISPIPNSRYSVPPPTLHVPIPALLQIFIGVPEKSPVFIHPEYSWILVPDSAQDSWRSGGGGCTLLPCPGIKF